MGCGGFVCVGWGFGDGEGNVFFGFGDGISRILI